MNRTSASVITLAIVLSMVATPAFRSSSNRGPASSVAKPESTKTGKSLQSQKTSFKKPECKPANSFEEQLYGSISTAYFVNENRSGLSPACTIPSKVKTEVMLAFVPDPKHTNLALLFDRQMDALQQGILDSGWTFDQAIMPWNHKEAPQFDDFISTDLEQKTEEAKEKEPGLLIFRRDSGDKLLVFVIGESPTGGIHKEQFGRTKGIITQLFGVNRSLVMGIFGPTFSGSLQSLAGLLQCVGKDKPLLCPSTGQPIFDFSGTVTSRSAVEAVANPAKVQGSEVQGFGLFKDNPNLIFASFQEDDDYAISRFLKFAVVDRHYCANEIAVLSEDESAYGTSGFKPEESNARDPNRSESENSEPDNSNTEDSRAKQQQKADPCGPKASAGQMVHLYFPREISQLRNAYQQSLAQAAQTSNSPGVTLPLDLQSSDSNDDTVPEYSHKQLPLSQEAVLLGIASELRYHSVKLVILRATDSLDQLFLARYLRGAYPQGRIVIFGADLLFRREIQDSQLHGIMVLSTYSLTPGSDHDFQGTDEIHVDRVFPSSDAVGSYNASKMLATAMEQQSNCVFLRDPKLCSDQASSTAAIGSLPNTHLFQYAVQMSPIGADKKTPQPTAPPVHLTVLGHEGFAEIATLPADTSNKSSLPRVTDHDSHIQEEETMPNAWHLFWVMAVIVALAYCYFLLSASILSSSEAVAHLAPPQPDSRVWLFAVNSYLHFALLLTVLVPFFYFKVAGFEKWSLVTVMIIVCAAGIYDLRRRQSKWFAYALPGACLLTTAVLALVLTTEPQNSVFLFMQRSAHLTSGVSPLLPILLILGAGLWGAWHSVSSSSLVDGRRPVLPEGTYSDPAGGAQRLQHCDAILEDKDRKKGNNGHLLSLLDVDYVEGRALVACIVIFAAVWWYRSFRPLQTLESTNYEYLLAAIVSCIAALLLIGILRLQSLWTELRRLLVALDSLPLRRGFKRLEGFSWSPMWRVGAGNMAEMRRLISRQRESLRCLHNLGVPGFDKQLQDEFGKKLDAVKDAYANAKSGYNGYPIPQSVPATGSAGMSAQGVGGGAAAKPALEPTGEAVPDHKPTLLQSLPRWLKLSPWIERVLGQGARDRELIENFGALQQEFAKTTTYALAFCETQWSQETSIASNGEEKEGSEKIAEALEALARRTPEQKAVAEKEEKLQKQLRACEEFVSLLYTSFILVVLVRIRGLIVAAGGMYVLLLAALNVYPFQPQVVIRTGLMILLVVIVGIVGFVYAQMHRDSTLSYITGTQPGELGLNFWVRIVSFVAVPAISLLASQFPQVAGLFSSWVEPAVNALK